MKTTNLKCNDNKIVTSTVRISPEQYDWLKSQCYNASALFREFLKERMKKMEANQK